MAPSEALAEVTARGVVTQPTAELDFPATGHSHHESHQSNPSRRLTGSGNQLLRRTSRRPREPALRASRRLWRRLLPGGPSRRRTGGHTHVPPRRPPRAGLPSRAPGWAVTAVARSGKRPGGRLGSPPPGAPLGGCWPGTGSPGVRSPGPGAPGRSSSPAPARCKGRPGPGARRTPPPRTSTKTRARRRDPRPPRPSPALAGVARPRRPSPAARPARAVGRGPPRRPLPTGPLPVPASHLRPQAGAPLPGRRRFLLATSWGGARRPRRPFHFPEAAGRPAGRWRRRRRRRLGPSPSSPRRSSRGPGAHPEAQPAPGRPGGDAATRRPQATAAQDSSPRSPLLAPACGRPGLSSKLTKEELPKDPLSSRCYA
ncbi:basic proline-rich protein-like [Orcinus orca]|uniref:basic proline-rich protein-like n=1 Tax=Orcinus orca TaxID=9733 RepID=UPI0014429006|nr:basic proline-rich protein-like [Orcinus orca]